MTPSGHDRAVASALQAEVEFAADIAAAAGGRLLQLRASGRWPDPAILGDVADHAADGFLQGFVRGRYPADGLLSEETVDDPSRLTKVRTWIVDPLDGTNEYRTGRHDWAVHVGLAIDGRAVLGAVAMPAIGCVVAGVCAAGAPHIAVRGDRAIAPDAGSGSPSPLRIAVSRSHTPSWVQRFARELGDATLVPSGSVGFKVGLLLFGDADVYVHRTGLNEWDTCAPEALARAAGYTVCRIDGSEQRYNRPDPRNDELVVCRPRLRERVLAALVAGRATG